MPKKKTAHDTRGRRNQETKKKKLNEAEMELRNKIKEKYQINDYLKEKKRINSLGVMANKSEKGKIYYEKERLLCKWDIIILFLIKKIAFRGMFFFFNFRSQYYIPFF